MSRINVGNAGYVVRNKSQEELAKEVKRNVNQLALRMIGLLGAVLNLVNVERLLEANNHEVFWILEAYICAVAGALLLAASGRQILKIVSLKLRIKRMLGLTNVKA